MKARLASLILILTLAVLAGSFFLNRFHEPAATPMPADTANEGDLSADAFLPYAGPDAGEIKEEGPSVPLPNPSKGAIPGEYTVFFKDAESMAAFLEEAEAAGLNVLGAIPQLRVARIQASGSRLSPLLEDGMEVDNNYLMQVPRMPDPNLWQEQNLRGFNASVLSFLGIPSDPSRLSWGKGVTIAILDTGWPGHSAIDDGQVREIDLIGGSREGEFSGHGAAVAGLVGSTNPFAPGVSPGSDILAVRVLDSAGQGDAFTLAEAILVAVDNGADVINMSLGGYGDSQVLREAVRYANESGVVLVAASGNDGISSLTFPAAYDSVIGVTAVDANGNRAPFSNYGEGVDVAAPGYQIHALWEEDEYIYFNGTSASAPLVSGLVARLLENGQASSPAEVQALVTAQANETGPPGDDPQYGAGIINSDRLEKIGQSGIFDMALGDLYPATEESDGATFPLYVSFENRGTEYLPAATVEISVNGTPYYYKFSGMDMGEVESVQIPVSEALLEQGETYSVSAKVILPDKYTDSRPANDGGSITLSKPPEG